MTGASLFCDFTVAIPTYNGGQRISYVLECLKWQLGTERISWEVIVVDNNSTDNTEAVVRQFQKDWPNLRYTVEPKQGAAFARQRAVRLARSPLIGFLDDDNLPSAIWINQAVKFFREHPQAGIVGSHIRGQFDSDLPANFDRIAPFLALINRGPAPLLYSPDQKVLPPGAGMAVRRGAWLENVPDNPVLGGRTKDSMLTGEDMETTLHIQQAGWEVWYNPTMRVEHKIPAQRLTREYLCDLMRGIGLSRHRTRMLSVKKHQRYFMVVAYAVNDIRKILRHIIKYRAAVWQDPVTVSEMTLYIYSLISPAFFLKMQLDKTLVDSKLGETLKGQTLKAMQDQRI
ncbi:MAG: hormogonium polysaccharide biosynthesis glycosyltransferase HpsE [Cyanobacteria bacterium P01_H01_bin.153]